MDQQEQNLTEISRTTDMPAKPIPRNKTTFFRFVEREFSGWTPNHAVIFLLTFFSYALFHASRKTFSNVKSKVEANWIPTIRHTWIEPSQIWQKNHLFESESNAEQFLGILDAIFMLAYAVGLFISGYVGDRYDHRLVLTFGMFGSGISLFLFGMLSEVTHLYSKAYYVITYILFGLTQACAWPTEVAIMANWFGKGNRGFVLGLWASCQSVGNIFGAFLVPPFLKYGYEYAFLVTSSLMIAGGVVIFFALVPHPEDLVIHCLEHEDPITDGILPSLSNNVNSVFGAEDERPPAINFFRAILLPGVLAYCLCNACLKLVNYAFFFWLPFYLRNKFHWPTAVADDLSIWYDVGGIFGSVVGGVISDWMKCRAPVIVVMLAASLGSLYGYSNSSRDKVTNGVLMAIVGFFVGGPYNLIAATVAADLGTQPALAGNAEALSTVTGLIDGTGSVGSAIGQAIVPVIDDNLGWSYVFYLFIVMNFLAGVCLFPRLVTDAQRLCGSRLPNENSPLMNGEAPPGYSDSSATKDESQRKNE